MRCGPRPVACGGVERCRDNGGSSQPSPDGSDDQRNDETFASGEVLLVDEAVWFRHRGPLTTGEDN